MSKTIDQKVVEMRFDNVQFEKGIAQSTNSINNFKKTLDFGDITSSSNLKSVQDGFGSLNVSIDQSSNAFSALEQIAIGALRSIGAGVVDLGVQLANDLVNNIKAGYARYEEMMASTQTIMYALRDEWDDQGAEMEFVNGQLDKLNWFTDETSYNLSDMTNNIGKFVAAGIPLEDAVEDMMGIANWAALSGQNAETASRAMYNLSQAMGMGKLTVMDWKSIENANMATREFKNVAIQTGLAMGTLYGEFGEYVYGFDQYGHEIEVTADTFRSTLAGGWLDKDVLSATLAQYGEFASDLNYYAENTGIETTKLLEYLEQAKNDGLFEMDIDAEQDWFEQFFKDKNYDTDQMELLGEMLTNLTSDYYELGFAAFRAAQESKTFTDSLDYTKDAITTAWMSIFQNIFGNYLESKELWTEVSEWMYQLMVRPVEELGEMFDTLYNIGGFDYLKQALTNIVELVIQVKSAINDGFGNVFGNSEEKARPLLYLFEKIYDFTEKIKLIDWPWYSDTGNLTKAGESIARIFDRLLTNINAIKIAIQGAWEKIFPKEINPAADSLTDKIRQAAEWLEKLSEKFLINDERAKKLERAFAGLFAIFDILKEFVLAVCEGFGMFEVSAEGAGDGILDFAASIGDYLVSVRDWIKENDVFRNGVKAIVDFIKDIPNKLEAASQALFNMSLSELWETIKAGALSAWEAIKNFFTNLPVYAEQASQALFNMSLSELWENIKQGAITAWETIKDIFSKIRDLFTGDGGEGGSVSDAMPSGEDAEPTETFGDKIVKVLQWIKDTWTEVKPYIDEFIDTIKNGLSNIEWPSFKEVGNFVKELSSLGIISGIAALIWRFVVSLNKLEKDKKKIVKSIQYMFTSIGDAAKALKKNIQAQTFKTIATAILELAAAIFILALLPTEKLVLSSFIIVLLFSELAEVFNIITSIKTDEKKLKQITNVIDALAVVLAVMIAGIFLIATQMDLDSAIVAAAIIALLLLEVAVILAVFDQIRGNEKKAKQVEEMIGTVALVIVAIGAALMLATLFGTPETIGMAGLVMMGMLLVIGMFLLNLDKIKVTEKKVDSLVKVIYSVAVLIAAMGAALMLATMGGADWTQLVAAGGAMAAMMLSVAVALKIMPSGDKIKEMAAALTICSIAFVLIGAALAIATSSGADWTQLAVAGTIMAGMLLAMALAFKLMPDSSKIIQSAAALAIAGAGILILASALAILGGMNLEQIGLALLALLGALVLVLAAGFAASYIGPGLIMLGVAFALIGAGALMASAGLWLIAQALETIFNLNPEGINTMMLALTTFFDALPGIASNVGSAIGSLFSGLASSITSNAATLEQGLTDLWMIFINTFTTVAPAIVNAIGVLLQSILTMLIALWPSVEEFLLMAGETALKILQQTLEGFLNILIAIWPQIEQFLLMAGETALKLAEQVIVGTLQILIETTPMLFDLLRAILDGIIGIVEEYTPRITELFFNLVETTLQTTLDHIGTIVSLAVQIAIEIGLGFIDGLTQKLPDIIDKGIEFVLSFINGIADGIEKHAEDIRNTLDNLVTSLINTARTLLGLDAGSGLGAFFKVAGDMIADFVSGITDGIGLVVGAVTSVIDAAINAAKGDKGLDEASPSKKMRQIGEYGSEGLAEGFKDGTKAVSTAASGVAHEAVDSMSDAFSRIGDRIHKVLEDTEFPTITPVVDLSNVTAGANSINSMFSGMNTIDFAGSASFDFNNMSSNNPAGQLTDAVNNLSSKMDKEDMGNTTYNNTFNISGDDPKSIANEVSGILQNQVDRRNAVWA